LLGALTLDSNMNRKCIGVLDFAVGNIMSIMNALKHADINCLRVTQSSQFSKCSHLILPGVGSFASGMKKLLLSDLHQELNHEVVDKGKPILGICLGMQMLCDVSYEYGTHKGLGMIHGRVVKLESKKFGVPLPHIGWSEVRSENDLQLLAGIDLEADFYFVHSFHMEPYGDVKTGVSQHGVDFVSVVESGNIFGTQFHPEKSQSSGIKLLTNFSEMAF
jgi:glutamine amidotransferase